MRVSNSGHNVNGTFLEDLKYKINPNFEFKGLLYYIIMKTEVGLLLYISQ